MRTIRGSSSNGRNLLQQEFEYLEDDGIIKFLHGLDISQEDMLFNIFTLFFIIQIVVLTVSYSLSPRVIEKLFVHFPRLNSKREKIYRIHLLFLGLTIRVFDVLLFNLVLSSVYQVSHILGDSWIFYFIA